ncbi:Cysteine peptidase, asparagine active site-containing protein [Artemisia annua]|uniref:Cysteine peptidase, asparagine active site-containing protein n=1 Tax=Artemisia annua TaxID=35608 RepID=A0A2U1Q3B2_ARTAN|nr:Cysteine peptidase, asparagine active site-containing protein [Artemisia annua]
MATVTTTYAILLCLIISQTCATNIIPKTRSEQEVRNTYELWLIRHEKTYNALGEKERRFQIFNENLKFIDEHNASGNLTYKVGLNRFADLTNEEYRSMHLGMRGDVSRRIAKMQRGEFSQRYMVKSNDMLPQKVDWRESGAVTPIKNQGGCGEKVSAGVIKTEKIHTSQQMTES